VRLERRIDALRRVCMHGSGVEVEAYLTRTRLPLWAGTKLRVAVHAAGPSIVRDLEVRWRGLRAEPPAGAGAGSLVRELAFSLLPPTLGAEPPLDPLTGARAIRPEVTFAVGGTPVRLTPALRAIPVAEMDLVFDREHAMVVAGAALERVFSLQAVYNGDGAVAGPIELEAPAGLAATAQPGELALSSERREARVLVRVRGSAASLAAPAAVVARLGGRSASVTLDPVRVVVPEGLRVGLVRGADDSLQRALEDLGVPFEGLDEARLAVADLAAFSTVVLDMRTVQARADLDDHRDRILAFCEAGGRVVAFYHKAGEWNPRAGRPSLAPYPLEVGDERVAEEDAAVTLLDPSDALLLHPHPIGPADFAGWLQERGLNFPKKWDERWKPLLRMGDTGEKPLDGALLVAAHGKGRFVYCSLALYRQWRAGHEGAARLLVNLLAPLEAR
jgi:hypothetical protein